jgi:ABC-type antimicrobial peptide transport system permease subunit
MSGVMFYAMLVVLMGIMSILIANLVFLTCLERYKEIGTYRALGFSRWQVARLFMGEIFLVAAVFGGIGMVLGVGAVLIGGQLGFPAISPSWEYVMGKRLYLRFQPTDLVPVILICAAFIFGAAFYPSWRAVQARPVDALRED